MRSPPARTSARPGGAAFRPPAVSELRRRRAGAWFALHWRTSALGALAAASPGAVARGLATHVWLLLAWGAVVLGVEALRRAEARARAGVVAERMAVEARHRMLVSQVNPHFLFNTLNSVRGLAAEDPERTRTMVTRLAEFLRAGLDADPLVSVPLGRELDVVASYLAIEQVRFGERLRVTTDATPEARAAAVPPFLLHPLVENAVTHGRGAPLALALRAWCADGRLTVEIENGGTLALDASHRPGVGLVNVRERLALLYGEAASLALTQDGGVVRARLTVPLAAPAGDATP
ncbi:MAG: hypothetical protein AVDCRST_MAG11-2897 [uncultured Gemmatimonadaceae bacterium]|uniref:Signal transduction histidine kinase internal region domain-containing protein n=1 Tax=uncultured Gemmatimonadaceae bacterium TaxID=246130 RepID=A0A6J4LRX1_9BACT|nr:MAG: hypothetical protein AVDCRST_MAG11-2897 [uncultured Gemmatimonadaceae bacterium]